MSANHQSKSYRLMRSVALWLHQFKCYNCSETNLMCEVHHLNHNSGANFLENLAPLCPSCHALFHRIPMQPPMAKKKILVALLRKVVVFSSKE